MEVNVQYGQLMMDVALQHLGDIERLFEIAVINDAEVDDEALIDLLLPDLTFDEQRRTRPTRQLFTTLPPASNDSGTTPGIGGIGIPDVPSLVFVEPGVKVRASQVMIDIALQELGDPERIFEIAVLNDTKLTEKLVPGHMLLVPQPDTEKRTIVNLFAYTHKPACGNVWKEGIDYWYIEDDNIVQ